MPWRFCLYSSSARCSSTTPISRRHRRAARSKDFAFATDAENLRGALEEQKLIEGTESEYGLYVLTVDGETADEGAQQWWCFTKGGEMLMTGVDDTMIADGESYEITLTTGW